MMKMKIEKENSSLLYAIAYICYKFSENSRKLNSIKLNKILWFADAESIDVHHRTITGKYEYTAQDNGPVLLEIPDIMNVLGEQGVISFEEKVSVDSTQSKYIVENSEKLQELMSHLSEEDKRILGTWVQYGLDTTTRLMVEKAHNYAWWNMTPNGQSIPVHLGHIGLPKEKQAEFISAPH